MFQFASTLVNQLLLFNMFCPRTSSRVYKVSIFQLRQSPFYLVCFEVYLVPIG